MEIEYPSEEKKEQSIANIIKTTKPEPVGTIRFLIDAYREIGIKTILRNSYKIFILSAVTFSLLTACSLFKFDINVCERRSIVYLLSMFFYFSPFILLSTDFMYQIQERPFDVYEMQNTCKYTARHLILLRMPLFSLFTILIDIGTAVVWCSLGGTQYLPHIIGLIASGVMLYSLLNIAMFNKFGIYGYIGCAVIWLGGAAVFNTVGTDMKYAILTGIPVIIHIISCAMMGLVLNFSVRRSYKRLMFGY